MKNPLKQLKNYLLLWCTQSLSELGSSMTSYALVLWLYNNSGSALKTALLTVCSYAPYVLMSIFAGALSDKWNKKRTMLLCDLFAAMTTVAAFVLIKTEALELWHLYAINALNGLMNTVQQPASEVASTQLIPKEYYQKTSGLRSLSRSLNSLLTPVIQRCLCYEPVKRVGMKELNAMATKGLAACSRQQRVKTEQPSGKALLRNSEGDKWPEEMIEI